MRPRVGSSTTGHRSPGSPVRFDGRRRHHECGSQGGYVTTIASELTLWQEIVISIMAGQNGPDVSTKTRMAVRANSAPIGGSMGRIDCQTNGFSSSRELISIRTWGTGFKTELDQTSNIKVLLLVVLVIFHVERFV
ncbi:hypothetical protein Taro_054330 [Colocasia esculenta]|uniref:Uncharacterized protein n=1 Tax=Colocasia esculenta TaxID=4460 RepID=A0A843XQ54_COLES|nr:hypothetical protein [Colocasia esculenta]